MRPLRRTLAVVFTLVASPAIAHVPACDHAKYELLGLSSALELYAAERGHLPPPERWLKELQQAELASQKTSGLDPWGHHYVFTPLADDSFDLRTIGADARLGTDDDQTRADLWKWSSCSEPSFFSWSSGCGR
jgi:hypothetical protein